MAAITGTLVGNTEFAGTNKLITVTATITATSDTITLTAADHGGLSSIVGILGSTVTGGADAAFQTIQVSFSGLVLTVVSLNAAGAAATDFTGTTVEISLVVAV